MHKTYFSLSFLCRYSKGFSCQYALLSFIENCKKSIDNKEYAGAILMLSSKAFDTVHHELFIANLHAYGFSKNALNLLISCL